MVKGILTNRVVKEFDATSKMEHADLIAEMHTIENLPTQERLHLARMRRAQQLKVARQKEKEWAKLQRSQKHSQNAHSKRNNPPRRHISFENSVVLLEAASRNDIQEVATLLQRGITPDAANEDGLTALHQCCIDNNIEMLKLLLDYGANVDAQDSDKWTPLHAAATCGHLNLVKILIGRGANLLAVNTDGNMPYDLCDDEDTLDYIEAEMSKRGVTQELIDDTRAQTEKQMLNDLIEIGNNGGDLEEPDYQGATPLHIASANGYTKVVEYLLEHHVNVDSVDKDLWSPVHAAACWGHMEVLELLAQYGADLNAKNKDDETPSDICEDPEIRERIELLKTEQESKRLAEQQRRRVRRSQSNNTRAQSVRRTSLRDKTLTTKKDAVEETRLRLQAQEVFIAPDSTTEPRSLGTESILSQNSTTPSIATTSTTLVSATSSSSLSGPNSLPSTNNTIPNNNMHSNNIIKSNNTTTTTTTTNNTTNNSNIINQSLNNSGRRKSSSSLGGAVEVSSTISELDGNLNGNLRNSNSSGNIKSMGSGIISSSNNNSNSSGNLRKNSFSQTHRSDNSINNNSNIINGYSNSNLGINYNNNSRETLTNGIIGTGLSDTNIHYHNHSHSHNRSINQKQQQQQQQHHHHHQQQQQLQQLQQENSYHSTSINNPHQYHHTTGIATHQNFNNTSSGNSISRRPPEGKDNEEYHNMREKLHVHEQHGNANPNAPLTSALVVRNTNLNVHKMNSNITGSGITNNITSTTATTASVADRTTAEIFQATKENGKINVQVTVLVDTHNLDNTINQPGATLANLKKQRSQSRTTALAENGTAIGFGSQQQQQLMPSSQQQQAQSLHNYNNLNTTTTTANNQNQYHQNTTMLNGLQNSTNEFLLTSSKLDSTTAQGTITSSTNNSIINNNSSNASLINSTPATSPIDLNQITLQQQQQPILSPTLQQNNVTKYSGITGDVVSDSTNSKKCCILM
ncbi:protein phosphatase 1 regulatory subunit 12A isoform X1 [Condylostylus longicornis]|uniref:protein phosphatase 1 regulatory subunit 12A isoform X1 n=1 Tax=Condylostylus longicornis TaxID=2530218 RepID=UPI00244E3D9E|nr:protein phosphatase 1 regulatory subunit 12A isoform X1 [Condylostylus longicornis]XP_055379035.1 protein phosphatase 1 regulatory subunit 12A isoform X1 [Condylostylus longicornis]XP_055379036.1 protein phosphatase 1 regulatory subunit 12A isoform X1 [Condylostylus longicornis]